MNSELMVKIFTLKEGLKIINNVKYIRIKSDNYNLLVMKDYMPIIGEVVGQIDIIGEDEIYLNEIKAYYTCRDNVFDLIIKE